MLSFIFKNYRIPFLVALMFTLTTGILGYYLMAETEYYYSHGGVIVIIACLTGIVIPFFLLRKIKCPNCGSRFYWEYLNRGGSQNECSKCGFKF